MGKPEVERERVVVDCSKDVPRTKQSFKQECDINVIMRKYKTTGVLSDSALNTRAGAFGDFTGIGDFMECQSKVIKAKEAFAGLPANVRSRFRNDPALLVDFVSHSENSEEAISLGLVPKPVEPPKAVESTPKAVGDVVPEEPKAEPAKPGSTIVT